MNPSKSRNLRIGLVGCGRIFPNHLGALQAHSADCTLAAVCDIDSAALDAAVRQSGAAGYEDYQTMLAKEELDVVSICTPSGLHPEQGMMAARGGMHVIVEKPMALDLEQADRLIEQCAEAGVQLFVVKQNRLNQAMQRLHQAVADNRFGQIYGVYVNVFWRRTQAYYDQADWRGTWALDGGAFMNQACHFVDAAQWLIGEVDSVTAITATLARQIEVEDSGAAILRFRNGAIGTINVSMLAYPDNREGSLMILGENGTARVGGVALNQVEVWEFADQREEDEQIIRNQDGPPNVYGYGHTAYYRNVLDTLQGRGEPLTDGLSGRKSLELVLAIYQSADCGRKVQLPLS